MRSYSILTYPHPAQQRQITLVTKKLINSKPSHTIQLQNPERSSSNSDDANNFRKSKNTPRNSWCRSKQLFYLSNCAAILQRMGILKRHVDRRKSRLSSLTKYCPSGLYTEQDVGLCITMNHDTIWWFFVPGHIGATALSATDRNAVAMVIVPIVESDFKTVAPGLKMHGTYGLAIINKLFTARDVLRT